MQTITKLFQCMYYFFTFGSVSRQKKNLLQSLEWDHLSHEETTWQKLSAAHKGTVRNATIQYGARMEIIYPAPCHGCKVGTSTHSLTMMMVNLQSHWQHSISSAKRSNNEWTRGGKKIVVPNVKNNDIFSRTVKPDDRVVWQHGNPEWYL